MKELIKREFRRDGFYIVINAGLMLVIPFILVIMCLLMPDKIAVIRDYICALEGPAGIMLGFEKVALLSDYRLLLSAVIVITNFIAVWNACSNTVYIMNLDEENGSLFYMCNQMYSRKDFAHAKYIYSVIHYVMSYVLWYVMMILFVIISNIGGAAGIGAGVKDMLFDMAAGVFLGSIFVSFTYLYCVWSERKEEWSYSLFVGMFIVGTVLIANIYKVVNIVGWVITERGGDGEMLMKFSQTLSVLRCVSPITMMNPFTVDEYGFLTILLVVAVIVSAAAYIIGEKKYKCREFYSEKYDIELKDIKINIEENDFFVIFGPDYSGKTKLLNGAMGLEFNNCGKLMFCEKELNCLTFKERRDVRFVPDSVLLEDKMTVEEYIIDVLLAYDMSADILLDAMLEMFGIELDDEIMGMTFEKNKLMTIVAALITMPKLLILDEPFNFLSDAGIQKLLEVLKMYNDKGVTVIIASEHYEDVKGYANRYAYMCDGKLIRVDDSKDNFAKLRKLTVSREYMLQMNTWFKKPIKIEEESVTYMYARSLKELSDILKECEVNEENVVIGAIRLEDILSLR